MSPELNKCKSSVGAIMQVVYKFQVILKLAKKVAGGGFDMWKSITNLMAYLFYLKCSD